MGPVLTGPTTLQSLCYEGFWRLACDSGPMTTSERRTAYMAASDLGHHAPVLGGPTCGSSTGRLGQYLCGPRP